MEPIEEQTCMSSSQGKEDEGSGVSRETLEGLALLQWQREDGRMSRREGGQRTPMIHRVNMLSNTPGGQQTRNREDSDNNKEGENRQAMHTPIPVWRASGVVREGQETQNDAPNQHNIASPSGISPDTPLPLSSSPCEEDTRVCSSISSILPDSYPHASSFTLALSFVLSFCRHQNLGECAPHLR